MEIKSQNNSAKSNELIQESSPYLLQHAYNPVKWHAWNKKNLAEAKQLQKPIIISIGYSACHWCHVMEKESFEDSAVAKFMNKHFYAIKVDREERPDVDELYMRSVHLITGSGGWPLNVFAMPDGKVFHGGTYFSKDNWLQVLQAVHKEYTQNSEKLAQFANELEDGILQQHFISPLTNDVALAGKTIANSIEKWRNRLDYQLGGSIRSPKFPMPGNLLFLMRFAEQKKDEVLQNQVELTLKSLAFGGIYDHLGGGFARYSTDAQWKVPHFEKMLYDNAQLISLYAQAFSRTKNTLYKEVAEQSIRFVKKDLLQTNGLYSSALDADSEGEEGKYYVWRKAEIKSLLTEEEWTLVQDYYNLNHIGYWEEDKFILLRKETDEEFAKKLSLDPMELKNKLRLIKEKLLAQREKRTRPHLDNKCLTSWNALMLVAFCDAYAAFGHSRYLEDANDLFKHLERHVLIEGPFPKLWHSHTKGESEGEGLCEDYALLTKALIRLFEVGGDIKYLLLAEKLQNSADDIFLDEEQLYFHMSKRKNSELYQIPKQMVDNVIPSDNSVMAHNLNILGTYLSQSKYIRRSEEMLLPLQESIENYGGSYANWLMLFLDKVEPSFELVITGQNAAKVASAIQSQYFPQVHIVFSEKAQENVPLFSGRWQKEIQYFLCRNNTCQKPVATFEEIQSQIRSK